MDWFLSLIKKSPVEESNKELFNAESEFTFPPSDSIPYVVKRILFDVMDIDLKHTCRMVCKEWKHLIDTSPSLTFQIELSDTNLQWVNAFGNDRRIKRMLVKDLHETLRTTSATRCLLPKNVDTLCFKTRHAASQVNAVKLLQLYSVNIRKIEASTLSLGLVKNITAFYRIRLQNLTELFLTFNTKGAYLQGFAFLRMTFPSITKLTIEIRPQWTCFKHKSILYKEIYQFISQTMPTLKSLTLLHPRFYFSNRNSPTTPLFTDRVLQKTVNSFALGKLDELEIKLPHLEGIGKFNLGLALISSQRHLRVLNITDMMLDQFPLLSNTLLSCQDTLSVLELHQCRNPFGPVVVPGGQHVVFFNWLWLKNCRNLRIFHFTLKSGICSIIFLNPEQIPSEIQELTLPGNVGDMFIKTIFNRLDKLHLFGFQHQRSKLTVDQLQLLRTHPTLKEIRLIDTTGYCIVDIMTMTVGGKTDVGNSTAGH